MPIQRLTFFKVADVSDIPAIYASYDTVRKTNTKDGKTPYILECHAYQTFDDPRNQGYNFVGVTKFESLDDMKYYDEACEAHKKLKQENAGKFAAPPMTVYYEL